MTIQQWRRNCIVRDQNKCRLTGLSGDIYRLEVHHLFDKSSYPKLATKTENGITLLRPLHRSFHKWLGGFRKTTTKKDFERWKNSPEGKKEIAKYKPHQIKKSRNKISTLKFHSF